MKNLDKFFNKRDIPWVNMIWEKHYKNGKLLGHIKKGSFWWRDILKLLPNYKEVIVIQIKNVETCMFWKDKWLGQILQQELPESYSLRINQSLLAWLSVYTY